MSSHRDGVNPLRPYYIPPSIGEAQEPPTHVPGPNPFSHGNATGKYASKARDIFSDLDYKDYIAEPSPSAVRTIKDLVDELLWKYTSVLMAQPFEVAKTILQKEGAWGVWKGSNATFLYNVLQSLLENWSRSLLSALFNVPDLGVKDDLDRFIDIASPYPWASLFVAAAAAVATGLILSPLDIVRTRLIATTTSKSPRRTLPILRSLPSYTCPPSLVIPTALHSLVHPLLALTTPLVLRTKFMIDREVSPTTFSVAKFCSSSVALFIKLPLETVLRRGQVAVLNSPSYMRAIEPSVVMKAKAREDKASMDTIIQPGKYNGVFGTMSTIVHEEGSHMILPAPTKGKPATKKSKTKVAETVYRKGQGLEGLWRGWKVSWWGLVGLWTAGVVGGGGDGEF
ncbi:putative mitochondrial fusion protein [Phaeoacremonium minimum UCRPA7]|uniref:Putative mitochondrial fusion protein n=1 Tax=Phaeoacremonium minimum (strain UCR-PA7) TaxID=1286976 RepID=R8BLK8_PHAM7|nr:putative mitochondrial fusion protein [Phaeoacremonium minimum UCRPA7]EOO00248.1 putative mitochondrial fusion protein [Phaeoacremonium minimum UCRPA7]